MRKYENILDQQNAKKAANKQLAFADVTVAANNQPLYYPAAINQLSSAANLHQK